MSKYNFKSEDEFYSYLKNLFENIITDIKVTYDNEYYKDSFKGTIAKVFDFKIHSIEYILKHGFLKGTSFGSGKTFKFILKENEIEKEIYTFQTKSEKASYFKEKLKNILVKNLILEKYNILNNFEKIEKKDNNVFILYYSSSQYIMLYNEQILISNEVKVTPKALFHDANAEAIIKVINEVEYDKLITILNSYYDIYNNEKFDLSESEILNLLKFN